MQPGLHCIKWLEENLYQKDSFQRNCLRLKPDILNTVFDRELLAVFLTVIHFGHLNEGHHVVSFTDHKLCGVFHCLINAKSVSNDTSKYTHKRWKNDVADYLSIQGLTVQIDTCDLPEIIKAPSQGKIKSCPYFKIVQHCMIFLFNLLGCSFMNLCKNSLVLPGIGSSIKIHQVLTLFVRKQIDPESCFVQSTRCLKIDATH